MATKKKGQQRAVLARFAVRVVTHDGKPQLAVDHRSPYVGGILVMDALGTASANFLAGLLGQLSALAGRSAEKGVEISEHELNFMLDSIKGVAPRDEIEAMLAAQMTAIHNASMSAARQLVDARGMAEQERSGGAQGGHLCESEVDEDDVALQDVESEIGMNGHKCGTCQCRKRQKLDHLLKARTL